VARRVAGVAAASLGVLILVPGVAGAAFPGIDGAIVYQGTEAGITPCDPYTSAELFSVLPTGGPVSQVDCSGHTDQHPFVSPDGSEVVFASNRSGGSGAFQLYTESLQAPGTATDVSYPANAGIDDYPSWAPAAPGQEGTIIFQRTLPGGVPQLYIEDVNTPSIPAKPVFSAPTGTSDTEPVYDPSNADIIAFVRQTAGGPQQIYTYDLSTPSVAPVDISAADGDNTSNDSKPDFAPSPTGTPAVETIVFQSDRPSTSAQNGPCPGTQLYTSTIVPGSAVTPVFQVISGGVPTGQQACPMVDGVAVVTENPVFSPQGDAVAYDQPGPASQDVYAYAVSLSGDVGDTGTTKDLTPNFATDESPSWAAVYPGTSTPEAPQTLLLPAAGTGVVGATALVVRRRRRKMA
jgi:hypothetical protein